MSSTNDEMRGLMATAAAIDASSLAPSAAAAPSVISPAALATAQQLMTIPDVKAVLYLMQKQSPQVRAAMWLLNQIPLYVDDDDDDSNRERREIDATVETAEYICQGLEDRILVKKDKRTYSDRTPILNNIHTVDVATKVPKVYDETIVALSEDREAATTAVAVSALAATKEPPKKRQKRIMSHPEECTKCDRLFKEVEGLKNTMQQMIQQMGQQQQQPSYNNPAASSQQMTTNRSSTTTAETTTAVETTKAAPTISQTANASVNMPQVLTNAAPPTVPVRNVNVLGPPMQNCMGMVAQQQQQQQQIGQTQQADAPSVTVAGQTDSPAVVAAAATTTTPNKSTEEPRTAARGPSKKNPTRRRKLCMTCGMKKRQTEKIFEGQCHGCATKRLGYNPRTQTKSRSKCLLLAEHRSRKQLPCSKWTTRDDKVCKNCKLYREHVLGTQN